MSLMKSLLTGACLTMLPLTALADPALIFDLGGKFDKSFNEAAYVGAERWKAETGGSYKELEMQSEAQREQALRRLAETGAQVRLMPTLALSVLVTDRSIAIVDITNHDPSGYGCIVVRHTPLVMALNELVDASFAGSTEAPRARADARSRFGARQAQTLALLAAGATDSTIARQVGVSQRTVERFVRTILDDLGASTRFQAGAQAERAGLL